MAAASFLFSLLLLSASLQATHGASAQSPAFISTVQSALEEISTVQTLLSSLPGIVLGDDNRLSRAIQDCVELLSFTVDELNQTRNSSSSSSSDFHAWLSAAAGNQETCAEGIRMAGGFVGEIIADGLNMVTSLVRELFSEIPNEGIGRGRKRLQEAPAESFKADVVVAGDGSGDFKTVEEAVAVAPERSERRFVIYVKAGVYNENVEIGRTKWNIVLVGDGMGVTVISGSRNFVDGWTTFSSATLAVSGKGFIMRDMTVENTSGPEKHQAVALRSDSDLSVFFRVEFLGNQDTLYAHSLRQFYRECTIKGTVDFIFGNAAAVFQACQIVALRPLPFQKNAITAQSRSFPDQTTGFSIHACNLTVESGSALSSPPLPPTYLGRPWKEYSTTVVMESFIGEGVRKEGWLPWAGDFALNTLFYGEFLNYGPGANVSGRVTWPGFHVISRPEVARNFTVGRFIDGDAWLPGIGVRYTAGLLQ
ncbi:pectinesterase/pectinesterase inhibitor PPE8B-like [Wolffia australiana]